MITHPSKLAPSTLQRYGMTDALCVLDPELHTGPISGAETSQEKAARVDVATDVCLSCPVLIKCLNRALGGWPEPGVWAGIDSAYLYCLTGADLEEVA